MALDFGEFDEEQNYGRNLDFGGLASLPEETEYDQFRAEYLARKERGMGAATWAFISGLPEAASKFIKEDVGNALSNDSMIASLFGLKGKEDFEGSWKALSKSPELGLRDTWNTIKTIQSNVRDYFNPEVKGEKEIQRAYARQKFELGYYNDAREHYLDQAAGKFKDDINLLADFADPTNLIPSLYGDAFIKQGIRKSIKGTAKGVSVTAKGAEKLAGGVEATLGYPAKVLEKKIPKGGNVYRGLQAGSVMAVGSDPFGGVATTMVTVGVTEALSKVAKATSKEVSEIASVLASPSSHARFLFKLSTNENVSKQTRALAARAYKLRGTRMYDVVFDSLVSGVSSAAMQTAIEFAKGKSAEDMSMAAGAGMALGAPVGALAGSRGSGKTDEARSDTGIENYLANKGQMLNKDTIAALKKVDKKTLVALSTLDEFSGLGNIRLQLLDQDSFAKIVGVDPKDAPSAFYNKESQNIIINEAKVSEGTDAASKIVLHEHGHDIMRQMMGSNPLMRRKILENFYDPNGKEFFFRDSEGSISGSIRVNEQAQQFAKDYADKIRKTDEDYANSVEGTNAYLLAEEIAAEQFSGLMRESPNVFAKYNKSFRHSLMNTARLALSKMGIVEPDSGNLIDSPISESMLKNDGVANVFNNYMQTRNDHYRQRADDIETGRKHEPRAGQSSDNRFTELFGGKGVSTAIGSHYMLKDQTMFDELVQQVAIDSESLDTDLTGIGKGAEGKRLSEGVRNVFRSAGSNAKAAMEFVDFLQLSIDRRQQIKFGYRSANWNGKTGYNPFYERSFTPIGWQISPKKPSIRKGRKVFPNLKVVGYDADIIASNVELLQQAGFITDQTQFFEDFAAHADSVLQESGEGRINPLGKGENELFTAALGMKESGQKLQNPKLNEFFSNPDNKLKNAYKSYDLGGMAGAANMNKGGFAFDYNNAKHNYMPMLSGAGADGTTVPQTMYMPSMSTKDNFDSRGLRNNLLEEVLPNIKQDKFTPEQFMSEVNKSKGAKEFLEDIGIDQKTLNEIKRGKIIDKSTLEFLIGANQKILDLSVDNSKNGDPIYGDSVERGYRENYEEILFLLPESEKYIGGDQSGGHWENDRVLFHVRKTDRILPNGETAYHIEEIQSDWHQYAKGVGYDNSPDAVEKFARKKELQKILDEGERKYAQRKGNAVRERFFVDEDIFRGIYKNKLQLIRANYETDSTQIEKDLDTILTMITEDNEVDGFSRVHHNIIGVVRETKKFFGDRLKEHQEKEIAQLEEAQGLYPKEGEVDFYSDYYSESLTPTQYAHYLKSYEPARDVYHYAEHYFKHRKNLMVEDPYKDDPRREYIESGHWKTLSKLYLSLRKKLDEVQKEERTDADLQNARIEIREMNQKTGSIQSAAPMKKSWHSRGLAEAINNAWKEGRRYVTWVTGERSAQQNRLDEHFNFVNVTKLDGKVEKDKLGNAVPDSGTQYKIHAESKTGRSVRRSIKDADELAKTIGKDAADHAVKELRGAEAGTQIAVHDVEKPHTGRRIFYDKMVVDAAKRFAKVMGTRPPIKTEIALLDRDSTAAVGTHDEFGKVKIPTQQVWLMELPSDKPQLPLYMPNVGNVKGDGANTTGLVRDYGKGSQFNGAFRNWFKDSKVVDYNGNPLVVSHGTYNDFTEFDRNYAKNNYGRPDHSMDMVGSWFTTEQQSKNYADPDQSLGNRVGKTMKLFLSIQNPLVMDWKGENPLDVYTTRNKKTEEAIAEFEETNIAFEYNQVKQKLAKTGKGANSLNKYEKSVLENYTKERKKFLDNFREAKSKASKQDTLTRFASLVEDKGGSEGFRKWAKAQGYDGVHLQETTSDAFGDFNPADMWIAFEPNQIKSATGNKGTFDPSNPDIRYMPDLPTKPEPVLKTKKAYKLFRVGKDKKLYPLFVNADQPVRIGEWQVAEMGQNNPKTGKVKSKIGDLAYRAGWHASDLPMALHIGAKSDSKLKKPDLRRPDQVWAEVELADDYNWSEVAKERAEYNRDGTIKARTAHIVDQVPYNGHYRYKTNPNMQGEWLIGGQMKVNRVLSPTEVKNINDNFGLADLRRNKPQIKLTPEDLMYMPAGRPTESVHGYIPPVIKTFDDDAIQYIPDFLVGKNVFPVLGDRLMVGFHKCRSGNVYECRGGHDHPLYKGHKGQVAWACGQSGEKHDSVVAGLIKGIEKSDGYAATVLMSEEALASNRTYARIMMDELEYDSFHVQGGKAIVEKYIQQAAKSLDLPIRNLEDLRVMTPTMVFDLRKALLSRVMSNQYKAEIKRNAPKGYNAMSWKDLYKSLSSYKDADGYRHGDIIHILKFDTSNPLINLNDIGATPDPTYDVSFRGTAVHTMEGHVSAFDIFKEGLDVFAYDESFNAMEGKKTNPQRTIQPDRSLGSSSYRVMQMRTGHDLMQRPLTSENTLPSEPIKYKAKVKADEKSLYFRDQKNKKLRKEKQALL